MKKFNWVDLLIAEELAREIGRQINPKLTEINNSVQEVKQELVEQTPKGEVTDRVVEVGDSWVMVYDEKNNGLNWTAFDIFNYGEGAVYMAVNKIRVPEAPIRKGESLRIDAKRRGAIKKIYLKCSKGNTATVKFHVLK